MTEHNEGFVKKLEIEVGRVIDIISPMLSDMQKSFHTEPRTVIEMMVFSEMLLVLGDSMKNEIHKNKIKAQVDFSETKTEALRTFIRDSINVKITDKEYK